MSRHASRIAAALAALVLAGAFASVGTAGANGSCWDYKRSEKRFARKMNDARDNNGKDALKLDPEISKVARVHARKMLKDDSLYHSSNLGSRVTNWSVLGENVGVGYGVTQLHNAFMNSPPHKDNVLHGGFRHVGVGVATADGTMWVTVVFEGRDNPGTTLNMPDC